MALRSVLKHVAVPVGRVAEEEWVEGERSVSTVEGDPFPCVVFLPQAGESGRRGRTVKKPTMLYEPFYASGAAVQLAKQDRVLVDAPELNAVIGLGPDCQILFELDGPVQPAGKPGKRVKVMVATLKVVED